MGGCISNGCNCITSKNTGSETVRLSNTDSKDASDLSEEKDEIEQHLDILMSFKDEIAPFIDLWKVEKNLSSISL